MARKWLFCSLISIFITWISGHVRSLRPSPTAMAPLRKVGPRFNVRLENLRQEPFREEKLAISGFFLSPNDEYSEDNTLRTIFDDFQGVLTNILREERGAVRHTGQ